MVLSISPASAIERLERRLGLSSAVIAGALGVTPRTLDRWRDGTTHPQHEARRRLEELLVLQDRLDDTFTATDAARRWLDHPHPLLGGLTPSEVLRVGRLDRVHAAIDALESGVFI